MIASRPLRAAIATAAAGTTSTIIGATIEIGDNLLTAAGDLLSLAGTIAALIFASKAKTAAEAAQKSAAGAHTQLTTNGGTTARDELQAGQSAVWEALEQIRTDLFNIGARRVRAPDVDRAHSDADRSERAASGGE